LRFEAPLAPGTAARLEGGRLDLETLIGNVRSLEGDCEILLVEGAGGLLSPLGDDFDNRDFGAALGYPGLIVASNRLGAINQVRMTIECWQKGPTQSQSILGVALSDTSNDPSLVMQTNLTDMRSWLDHEQIPLYYLPYRSSELTGDPVSQILLHRLNNPMLRDNCL
jgi:dethiobiotin synthetase